MNSESTDDNLLRGNWTWEEMRETRRNELSNAQMEQLIEDLCRHLSI
jgi:hypothetical protein